MDYKEIVEGLVHKLEKADESYYLTGELIMTDDTYDACLSMLKKLDSNNPYLSKVGVKNIPEDSVKVYREIPMGTLAKYYKSDDVVFWAKQLYPVLVSPKYDGFACEIIYNDRGFISVISTRGSGNIGEDVSKSFKHINGIPLYDKSLASVIVRGECIISKKHHDAVKASGYNAMRNAVPGIVRSCNESMLKYVEFVAYEFIDEFDTRVEQREKYGKLFRIEDYTIANNEQELADAYNKLVANRETYAYDMDGVVLKSNNLYKFDDYRLPTTMIAWKFGSTRQTTILQNIEYQMGATGGFTPIGIFDKVEFQGASLTRASLGNMTRLYKDLKDITIGSVIEVSRRGDIIPYIESVVEVNEVSDKLSRLSVCPYCNQELEYTDYEPRCVNKSCKELLKLQVFNFIKLIGINGVGRGLTDALVDNEIISKLPDIYNMNPDKIRELPRQGDSSVKKWKALQDKRLTDAQILTAYPFVGLGEKIWQSLLGVFTIDELLNIDEIALREAKVKGIGDMKITSIVTQLSENRESIRELIESIK